MPNFDKKGVLKHYAFLINEPPSDNLINSLCTLIRALDMNTNFSPAHIHRKGKYCYSHCSTTETTLQECAQIFVGASAQDGVQHILLHFPLYGCCTTKEESLLMQIYNAIVFH
jgi:hypothetical protein